MVGPCSHAAADRSPRRRLALPPARRSETRNVQDADGAFLSGDAEYRLHLPPDLPAKGFWSVVVYDPQTRSELQTGQPFPSRNNRRDPLVHEQDCSVDILVRPEPPARRAENWIQTVPGKGWFVILQLYGPLEPWFDQSWKPGDVERI